MMMTMTMTIKLEMTMMMPSGTFAMTTICLDMNDALWQACHTWWQDHGDSTTQWSVIQSLTPSPRGNYLQSITLALHHDPVISNPVHYR